MNILKLPTPLLLFVGCRHEFCVPTLVSFRASFCAGISFFALFLLSTFVDTINEKEFFCLNNFFTSWLFLASQIASETSKKWFFMALVASLCTVGRRTDDEWTTNGRRTDGWKWRQLQVLLPIELRVRAPLITPLITKTLFMVKTKTQMRSKFILAWNLMSITLAKYEIGYLKEKRRVESSFPDETVCSAKFCCLRLPRRSSKSFQGNHSLNLAILILYSGQFWKAV